MTLEESRNQPRTGCLARGARQDYGWGIDHGWRGEPNNRERRAEMSRENVAPYACHVFVCTNDRKGERKSCADGNSQQVRKALKQEVSSRGWKKYVRVSQSGCLGLCAKGPNVIIYPQKIWFSEVSPEDVPLITEKLEQILGEINGASQPK